MSWPSTSPSKASGHVSLFTKWNKKGGHRGIPGVLDETWGTENREGPRATGSYLFAGSCLFSTDLGACRQSCLYLGPGVTVPLRGPWEGPLIPGGRCWRPLLMPSGSNQGKDMGPPLSFHLLRPAPLKRPGLSLHNTETPDQTAGCVHQRL